MRERATGKMPKPKERAKLGPVSLNRIAASLALLAAVGLSAPGAGAADPAQGPGQGHTATLPASSEDLTTYLPGAAELEGKVIAPCCMTQTIDIHGSPVSTELRREIRTRLRAGETPQAIEQSFIDRYGEKIIAVPKGSRLGTTGLFLMLGMATAGVGAFSLLRRWQRRSAPRSNDEAATKPQPGREVPDERLDAELSRLDRD